MILIRFESYNKGFEDGYQACNQAVVPQLQQLSSTNATLSIQVHKLQEELKIKEKAND